ncbi:polysaccharide biosynthesis tyrosine autokinase [Sphingomonas sp.]|uniref:GumC family protein n=1 Tax=Sphingomonas sp. TaxID=28214 RepID=UPI0025F4A60C|nr:polysaccharide biosynthesis tyrosine autokinase [Sphingomonas sp.]
MTRVPLQSDEAALVQDNQDFVAPLLKRYLHTLNRWKWVAIAVMTVAIAVGLVITLLTAPTYTATSQIEISRDQKRVTNVQGLEGAVGAQDLEFYETQYALLETRSLAERVARGLDLNRNDAFFEAAGIEINEKELGNAKVAPLTQKQADRREKVAISTLLSRISIDPVRRSRLVKISYTSRSPALSAQIANAWTQQFIGASMDRQFASTADARKFLEERLAALKTRLEESEREAVTYAADRGIVTLETVRDAQGRTQGQRTLAATDLEALNAALSQATSDRIAAESRARGQRGDVSPEALGNAAISDLRRQRAEAASEYARALVQFEPEYPAARALKEKIQSLDQAIALETSRVGASRSQTYKEAVAKEASLRSEVEKLRAQLDEQQRASIQYNIYQREADTNRQLYDALLQRYKEIGVAGTVGVNNIAIVDQARVPTVPSAPSLFKNMILAIALGLCLVVALVVGLEQIDEGVVDPQQISRALQVPLLGYTPKTDGALQDELQDAKSDLSEAYFSIHSNLNFSTHHGMPRSLMVTSTKPGEGKSTTSMALARIIGRTGKRVLLVDADLRSPTLNYIFELDNKAGFSNLLAGEDDLMRLTAEVPFRGLSVLTTGPKPPNPAELLSGDRIKVLIQEMLEHFDHIVMDAPPVLGLTDAPLLGSTVEGCVFVIQAGDVPLRGIRAALQRLRMVNTHIFGAVLTKLSQRDAGYGYGYGYGSSYGSYGRDDDPKRA